jgi:hypothetical protein
MQEYQMVLRSVSVVARPAEGIYEITSFIKELQDKYLSRDWVIQSTQLIKTTPADNTYPAVYEFVYHLVRSLNTAKEEYKVK